MAWNGSNEMGMSSKRERERECEEEEEKERHVLVDSLIDCDAKRVTRYCWGRVEGMERQLKTDEIVAPGKLRMMLLRLLATSKMESISAYRIWV